MWPSFVLVFQEWDSFFNETLLATIAIHMTTFGTSIDNREENNSKSNKDPMKLTCITLLFAILALSTQAQSIRPQHNHVSVLSMKSEVFYFKIDADFMGATVAVSDSTGTIFFTSELHTKRNLIDFYFLETGKYTIHFERDGVIEEYHVWLDKKEGHNTSQFIALKLQA